MCPSSAGGLLAAATKASRGNAAARRAFAESLAMPLPERVANHYGDRTTKENKKTNRHKNVALLPAASAHLVERAAPDPPF